MEETPQVDNPATNDSWPMFHHDVRRTGYSTSKAPNTNSCLWQRTTSTSWDNSPVVSNGKVFFGNVFGEVFCFNESTGELIWRYGHALAPPTYAAPAVSDGRVVISTNKGVLVLNETTGSKIRILEASVTFVSSSIVYNGIIFAGSLENWIYAWNATTGTRIWSYSTGSCVRSSPAIANDMIFVGSDDGYMYCLNISSGALIWKYNAGPNTRSGPTVEGGKVFGGNKTDVFALNATTGELIWNSTIAYNSMSSPAVAYNTVFLGSSDKNVYALNASNGAVIWKYLTGGEIYYDDSSPAVADGKVFIGSRDKKLYCLNSSTGSLIWSYTTSAVTKQVASPAVANGRVFVSSEDGTLYCFGSPSILTISTEGVSSTYPITISKDGVIVGVASDESPLNVTICVTAEICVDDTRIWDANTSARYKFAGWTGPATGVSIDNPIHITLIKNSSCTANYKTQYLTNITFKDNSGTISLDPTQIEALAPNGSLVTLSSFSNQWLENGTWTLKQVLWQGNNVKPSIDPTYNPTPSGTWAINCRVYLISFSNSFKDSDGTNLYTLPSSFKLTLPNGTTSAPLNPNLTYYIQNGTIVWSSIIWQGSEVTPNASFDATDGNPTVNCRVYSLTVDPVFYDHTGTVLIQPSSWSIRFPNDTIRTVSSPVTYNQTQIGNYSIVSIIWKGTEVIPDITPATSLTSDNLWSPGINCLLPTNLAISLSSSTSYVGFKVEINGNLTCNEVGLSGAPILVSYSVTGGESWYDITLVNTASYGSYSAVWMPSATGNYLIRANWAGNSTYPGTTIIISLAVTPFKEQNVFSVTSNSTISALAFNTTNWTLSFTATGPNGTRGYTKVTVAKSLVANITNIRVYLDGSPFEYTITSTDDSWLLTFTYAHSTHKVVVDLDINIIPEFPSLIILPLFMIATLLAVIVYRRKHAMEG